MTNDKHFIWYKSNTRVYRYASQTKLENKHVLQPHRSETGEYNPHVYRTQCVQWLSITIKWAFSFFQQYHVENKLYLNEMMVVSALY